MYPAFTNDLFRVDFRPISNQLFIFMAGLLVFVSASCKFHGWPAMKVLQPTHDGLAANITICCYSMLSYILLL